MSMPHAILLKLEMRWPDVKLCLDNRPPDYVVANKNLDTRLLSSPLLHDLRYNIYLGQGADSDFQKLKEIIPSSKLEVLHLGIDPRQVAKSNFQLDHVPSIRELRIYRTGSAYQPIEQRISWRHSLDWGKLLRLDLANLYPSSFFEQLIGCVPGLKSFRFTSKFVDPDPSLLDFSALAQNFLTLIDGLEELYITNYEKDIAWLWPAVRTHLSSLQTLVVHTPPDQRFRREAPPHFTAEQLDELCHGAISHLELDLELQENGVVRMSL